MRIAILIVAVGTIWVVSKIDAYGQQETAQEHKIATEKRENKLQSRPSNTFYIEAPSAEHYQPNCEAPKSHDEADTCIQRRGSKISSNAYKWTKIQTVVNIIGLLIVGLALLYSIIITRATIRAAEAARDSVKIAERAAEAAAEGNRQNRELFIMDQRPWLKMDVKPIEALFSGNHLVIKYATTINNVGKSPAISIVYSTINYIGSRAGLNAAVNEFREGTREMEYLRFDLFPNENIKFNEYIIIDYANLINSHEHVKKPIAERKHMLTHIIVACYYGSTISDETHENTFTCPYGFTLPGFPLPRNEAELKAMGPLSLEKSHICSTMS